MTLPITHNTEFIGGDEHTAIINVFSELNEWIDYDFIVPTDMRFQAGNALQEAYDAWFEDDPCDPLLVRLQNALTDACIPFSCVDNSEEDFDDED
jgi:hypothetical protein